MPYVYGGIMHARGSAILICLGLVISIPSSVLAAESGTWKPAGTMSVGRANFVNVLLDDGRVLVAGGSELSENPSSDDPSSAELFDPRTSSWRLTSPMSTARNLASGVLLADGRVLVLGGFNQGSSHVLTAETYDPATETWTVVMPMTTPRAGASATVLEDGRVLVVGGYSSPGVFATTAELYEPVSDRWTPIAAPVFQHSLHTATRLKDGCVLIAGGDSDTQVGAEAAEIYDPLTDQWSSAGSLRDLMQAGPAVRFHDGRVFVLGSGDLIGMAGEIYDPNSRTWTKTAYMKVATSRGFPAAALLADGRVLVAGGITGPGEETPTAEIYDPHNDTWAQTASMSTARYSFATITLPDGLVLAIGGCCEDQPPYSLSSAEIFTPVVDCPPNVVDRLDIIPLPIQWIPLTQFRFQWVFLRNRTSTPIAGPLAFVLDDMRNGVSLSPFTTQCFSPDGDPVTIIVPGSDNLLKPNKVALTGLWFFQTRRATITYTPRVLLGIPRK